MRRARYLLAMSLAACAVSVTSPPPSVVREPDVAAWLPRAPGRCLVVMPGAVDARGPASAPEQGVAGRGSSVREQVAPFSQSDGLPYRLGLSAYARVEQEAGRVELLRFAAPPVRAVVRVQLASLFEPQECDFAGCESVRAVWLDERTLRVERGTPREGASACAPLLREHPHALELAARPPAIASGELREARVVLELRGDGLARTSTRRYASPEAAERALRAALRGQEELPTLAGVPAEGFAEREGDTLTQRTFASFRDLQLALEDRARREPRAIDPADRAAVYAAFDADPARHESLLTAARALAPADDGLLRRQFQLAFARDPRTAYALAQAGQGEPWELRQRAALARFDAPALARALERAHGLRDGTRMAQELAAHVGADGVGVSIGVRVERAYGPASAGALEDPAPAQERAEYVFLAAARLAKARGPRAGLALRVPVLELPRVLATLAQAARGGDALGFVAGEPNGGRAASAPVTARDELGVELLVFTSSEGANTAGAGRPARLLTAADDAQLRALGDALADATEDGPVELRIAFAQRAPLALAGRREGGWLTIDSGSRALRGLRWDAIERLVAAPLRQLHGSAFPPDELAIEARDEAELGALEQSAARVARCRREGLTLRCRGPLTDTAAARRALLAVIRTQLSAEAKLVWSGGD